MGLIGAKFKITGDLTVEKKAWAYIRPDGSFLVDSSFTDEAHALAVGMGWPTEDEVAQAKAQGFRAQLVTVLV